jgi:hypothetical protein
MSGATILYLIAGFACFGVGAYLAATNERQTGIVLMGMGLIFQVLTLRQLKLAKKKGGSDAGG